MEAFFHDLRFALRSLRRDRAFSVATITTLALAIGLNVIAFTIMNAMLFRGLPLTRQSERVVYIDLRKASGQRVSLSYTDFEHWRSQSRAFEALSFRPNAGAPRTFADSSGHLIDIMGQRISADTLAVIGVQPALGRDFTAADEAPGAPPVAIVSHRFWESRLGKRADVVGATVQINGTAATIIGVMPAGFVFVYEQDVWMPAVPAPGLTGDVFGRLRSGATLEEARVELDTINRRLQGANPTPDRAEIISAQTYSQAYVGPDAPMIYGSLWAGAWFVLLIACANVTNLTLVRTTGQWREFSTRIALGAGLVRITRQMVMESLILASIAGALGWWITRWAVPRWAAATASRYLVLDYTVDSRILLYAVAVSGVAAILYSVAPIARIVRFGANGALKGDARGAMQGLRGKQMGALLVATQMALSIVLLSGAGVLVRSLLKIVNAETGVHDAQHLLVGSLRLPSNAYATPAERLAYFDRLDSELKTIAGIADVTVASHIPVNWVASAAFDIEGEPRDVSGNSAQFMTTGSNYFRVVGAPPITGRDFNDADGLATLPIAIVNQSFVERFLPGETVIGKRLRRIAQNQPGQWLTVVGVVPNIMQVPSGNDQTRQHFTPLVYVPFRQQPMTRAINNAGQSLAGANVLLRATVPFSQVAQAVEAAVRKTEPDARLEDLTTLRKNVGFDRDRMDLQHAELGKHAAAAPVFATVALLLSAIGLSAVIAHSVSQRTKEIGVRMAIGAAVEDIRRMILREGMTPVVIGVVAGLVASLAVNRILQSQLVGVSPYDPVTMTGAPAALILIALLACHLPARRAMCVDPAVALRHD